MHISVVIPVYKCSECIEELHQRLCIALQNISVTDYEIIFINDGSPENDWDVIRRLCCQEKKVKGLNLSRNFGQHKAITAGLDYAKGEWVVIMDCDLQDQPEELPKLYTKANEGYDVVFGKRSGRKDRLHKKIFSKCFNIIFSYLIGQKIDNSVSNYSIISKKVVHEIIKMRESSRSHALFIYWLGFDVAYVDIVHASRKVGKSAYGFRKAFNIAADFAISRSNKPLKLFVKFGVYIALIAMFYGVYLVSNYFINGTSLLGWTSLMVSLYFLGGLLLASMGLVGIYVGRTYDEVKQRPLYAIKDKVNIEF